MNKYREINFEELIELLVKYRDIEVNPAYSKFSLDCGRGAYILFNRHLSDNMQHVVTAPLLDSKSIGLQVGAIMNKIFIAGLGMITVSHNSSFDVNKNREMNIGITGGLPISSYNFKLFRVLKDSNKLLCEGSLLVELPKPTLFERFKVWFKNLFI